MSSVISKSVSRAFAVLELFRRERRALTATEIESGLQIPQASALVLAREMAELGYLTVDSKLRTYFPSAQLANLADWVRDLDLPVRRLAALAEEIARVTRETTSLCGRNGHFLQVEHFAPGTQAGSILMQVGRAAPLPCSGAGRALLATLADVEVTPILDAVRRREPRYPFIAADVLRDVRAARRKQHLVTFDVMIAGVAAVAFPLPVDAAGGYFSLVVGGPTPRIRADQHRIVRACRPVLAEFFRVAGRARAVAGARR